VTIRITKSQIEALMLCEVEVYSARRDNSEIVVEGPFPRTEIPRQ